MTYFRRNAITMAAASLFAGACFGQAPPPPPPVPDAGASNVMFAGRPVGAVKVVSGQFSFESKVVKGSPYMADAVTETTQTLADGNHIDRKETVAVARDSEGRTRREQVMGSVGPWATSEAPGKIVFINDPVAQVNYVLEPDRTARKMPLPPSGAGAKLTYARTRMEGPLPMAAVVRDQTFTVAAGVMPSSSENSKEESLGKQTMEGVQVEGTRVTTTIPAGQIGNELPIEITFERWYSPELQTTVMTKSSDPRTGDTVFRLTNIQRTEPPASMFEVPPDYKVEDSGFTIMPDPPMKTKN